MWRRLRTLRLIRQPPTSVIAAIAAAAETTTQLGMWKLLEEICCFSALPGATPPGLSGVARVWDSCAASKSRRSEASPTGAMSVLRGARDRGEKVLGTSPRGPEAAAIPPLDATSGRETLCVNRAVR